MQLPKGLEEERSLGDHWGGQGASGSNWPQYKNVKQILIILVNQFLVIILVNHFFDIFWVVEKGVTFGPAASEN